MKASFLVTLVAVASLLWNSSSTVAAENDEHLRERIRAMRDPVRDVPLPLIIDAIADVAVLPWNGQAHDELARAGARVKELINRDGLDSWRVNEAGNAVEDVVVAALSAEGFTAGRPVSAFGRVRAAGYPDLEVTFGEVRFYIEVKVLSSKTEDSTQRSFYLSPSTDFKVTHDAHHLLIAVELVRDDVTTYHARSVRWLDLSRLKCDLKYEFNASNRDLYRDEAGLVILESETAP